MSPDVLEIEKAVALQPDDTRSRRALSSHFNDLGIDRALELLEWTVIALLSRRRGDQLLRQCNGQITPGMAPLPAPPLAQRYIDRAASALNALLSNGAAVQAAAC